jgi:hypothetical protein
LETILEKNPRVVGGSSSVASGPFSFVSKCLRKVGPVSSAINSHRTMTTNNEQRTTPEN